MKRETIKPSLMRDLMSAMSDWYGIQLTEEQVSAVLDRDAALRGTLERFGVDTVERENFAGQVAEYVGVPGGWPINKDSEETKKRFFERFKEGARLKGIALDEKAWETP